MLAYCDYSFYSTEFRTPETVVLSTADFLFYARNASIYIKNHTFGNINELETIKEEVKFCTCELAEHLFNTEKQLKEKGIKSSENNDGYSVSFESKAENNANNEMECYQILKKWLFFVGYLYAGARVL